MNIRIFDNGGATLDRYTVVIQGDNYEDVFTMGSDPAFMNQFYGSFDVGTTEPHDNETELDACPESIYAAVHERMKG